MTSISEYGIWAEMLLVLGVGTAVIVGLAALGERLVRSAVWQRTFWQVAALALLVLCLAQWTGLSTALIALSRAVQPASQASAREVAEAAPVGVALSQGSPASEAPELQPLVAEPPPHVALAATRASPGDGTAGDLLRSGTESEATLRGDASATSGMQSRDLELRAVVEQSPLPQESVSAHEDCRPLPARHWLGFLWGVGTVLLVARMAWARVLLWRFRRGVVAASDWSLCSRVEDLARRLGIRRKVAVLEAAGLPSPVALGSLRPAVILPVGFSRQFDAGQQEAMLAHELAHVAGWDSLWQGLADLVTAMLWWHALAWWSRRRLRMAGETAADEASLLVPDGPDLLAGCLVAIGRSLTVPRLGWLSVEGPSFRSGLGRRVQRLLSLSSRPWPAPGGWRVAMARSVMVIALVVVSVSCTAWALPQANFLEGGTKMNVLGKSWRRSLAAAVLAAVLAPAPAIAAEERERPKEPARPAAGEERERPQPDARMREVMQKRQALEEKAAHIKRTLESLKPGQEGDAKELQAKLKAVLGELRQLPAPPGAALPERVQRRLQELKEALHRAKEAGKQDEAERIEREARELMQSVRRGQGGPQPPPEPQAREEMERRMQHVRVAIENLHAAGLHEQAEALARNIEGALQQRRGERRPEGQPRPEREGPPGARREGPPGPEHLERAVQELRGQVMEMRRQMDEIREHLKRTAPEKRNER